VKWRCLWGHKWVYTYHKDSHRFCERCGRKEKPVYMFVGDEDPRLMWWIKA
jgi:hypothetical protein